MGEIKKIAVLGLGESLKLYKPEDYELAIGVNDIWRKVKTEVVLCINPPKDFTPERYRYISESKPDVFYSQIINYDYRKDFRLIRIKNGYPDLICSVDGPDFEKSFCSPFVATQVAYKYYYADEIHLFGVDMVNHPHLDRKLCEKIKIHFRNLKRALDEKNCKLIVHGEGILSKLSQ